MKISKGCPKGYPRVPHMTQQLGRTINNSFQVLCGPPERPANPPCEAEGLLKPTMEFEVSEVASVLTHGAKSHNCRYFNCCDDGPRKHGRQNSINTGDENRFYLHLSSLITPFYLDWSSFFLATHLPHCISRSFCARKAGRATSPELKHYQPRLLYPRK